MWNLYETWWLPKTQKIKEKPWRTTIDLWYGPADHQNVTPWSEGTTSHVQTTVIHSHWTFACLENHTCIGEIDLASFNFGVPCVQSCSKWWTWMKLEVMSKHVPVRHFTAQNTPHGSLTKVFSAIFSSVIAPAANDGNIFRSFATVWQSFSHEEAEETKEIHTLWEKDEVWHTPPWFNKIGKLMAVRQFYVLARIKRANQGPTK